MAKPVIIFGAGASHDVVNTTKFECNPQFQPPLTNGLFDQKWDEKYFFQFPRLPYLLPPIREWVGQNKSLEDYLRIFKEDNDDLDGEENKEGELQLIELQLFLRDFFEDVGRYYIPGRPDVNNYHHFFTKLCRSGIKEASVITFNYDLFLDQAIQRVFGYDYKSVSSQYKKPVALFKVHGSVDWGYPCSLFPSIDSGDLALRIFHNNLLDKTLAKKKPLLPVERSLNKGEIVQPRLAEPLPQTKGFIIDEHCDLITQALKQTKKVIVIGWSASDQYFVDLIKENIEDGVVDLIIICKGDVTSVMDRLMFSGDKEDFGGKTWKDITLDKFGFSRLWAKPDVMEKIFSV